jgi:glycosyltransferase involved in cell wall biosynthesis
MTGTERYALELIRALISHNKQHELHLYFRDPVLPDRFEFNSRSHWHFLPFPRIWTHLRFAAELWRTHPDVTFVPAHTLPVVFPGHGLVTVHDLGYRYLPQAHTTAQRLYLDLTTHYSASRAALVLADSRATARDLTRFYRTPANKIRVVYPGVSAPPSPFAAPLNDLARQRAVAEVRAKYKLPPCYWLFVGTLQPRKNIPAIVEGYARWKKRNIHIESALVLAGGRGWLYDPGWSSRVDGVIETGYIDEWDKWALYAGAQALIFPSWYEGFGFPVIEAMLCGTAVICSNTSSLPEVGGDAAYYVSMPELEPGRDFGALLTDTLAETADQIAAYQERVADEGYLPPAIAQRRQQAQQFRWDTAAHEVLAILDCIASGQC